MGKCSCGLSKDQPKCDGSCKKQKVTKKDNLKTRYKKLKKLCKTLLSFILLKETLK